MYEGCWKIKKLNTEFLITKFDCIIKVEFQTT